MKQKNFLTDRRNACLLALLCCFMWGSAFPCIKVGYRLYQVGAADTASQILFAGIRFTMAGIAVFFLGSMKEKAWCRPTAPSSWKMIAALAFCQTICQHVFFYIGLANTSGIRGSILVSANVFFTILVACLVFRHENMTRLKVIGCLLGFSGVVLVNMTEGGFSGNFSIAGEGSVLLSALATAISASLVKRFSAREDTIVLSAYSYVLGGVAMVGLSLLAGAHLTAISPMAHVVMLYMITVSTVAYTLWAVLIKYNHISKIAIFNFATPMFGVILSAIFLQEGQQVLWGRCMAALALVCMGIILVTYEKSSEPIPVSQEVAVQKHD